jgi:hypothetical protein
MDRLNYRFTVVSPLAHFGEQKTSNVRLFRRQRVKVRPESVVEHKSKFKSEESRRRAIAAILNTVYDNVPPDRKKVTIWDEFTARVHIAAVQAENQFAWLNRICQGFGIASLARPNIVSYLEDFNSAEFLNTLKDELQYLIAFMRLGRESRRNGNENVDLLEEPQDAPTLVFKKYYDDVPFVAGNHIRGKMRRLLMYDFCQRIGLKYDIFKPDGDEEGVRIPESMYHRLMTGGNITDATGWEDIEKRESLIRMCPPLGLLGSAIGNMTIRGKLGVGDAQLSCAENATGDEPFSKFLDVEFGTRHDTGKLETEVPLANEKDAPTAQMIYYNEIVTPGAVFDHHFVLRSDNPLLQSVYAHMLDLFKQQPYLGGLSAKERGEVALGYDVSGSSRAYLDYVEKNKSAMLKFLTPAVVAGNGDSAESEDE